jgi:Cdc6-like AAA superfamily ATPase
LRETFVDIGPLFSTLKRPEHQVMYGRRGTGKTHALGNLQSYLEQQNICVVYLDMRTVGSAGGIYSDPREPVAARATPLLVDVVEALHNGLLEFALKEIRASLLRV